MVPYRDRLDARTMGNLQNHVNSKNKIMTIFSELKPGITPTPAGFATLGETDSAPGERDFDAKTTRMTSI
jgi:hypothetical protein